MECQHLFPPKRGLTFTYKVLDSDRDWETLAEARKFRNMPDREQDDECRREFAHTMNGIISEMKEAKRGKKPLSFDWNKESAKSFVEVWGDRKADSIISKMMVGGATQETEDFCREVGVLLNGKR